MAHLLARLLHVSLILLASSAAAQGDKPLATRELDVDGVRADVIESVRKDGVLTVRVRLHNTGKQPAKVLLVRGGESYAAAYLTARDKKYLLATDTSQRAIATPADGGGWVEPRIAPGKSYTWWGKFPAPPADVKSYTLYMKVGPPIEDVPIVDK